jgi:hypothetical protein
LSINTFSLGESTEGTGALPTSTGKDGQKSREGHAQQMERMASAPAATLEIQLKVQRVVNPVSAVYENDMVANHHITVSPRRRRKPPVKVSRYGTNGSAHCGRQHEALADIRLPVTVPVASLIMSEGIVMIAVPIPCSSTVTVVKTIVASAGVIAVFVATVSILRVNYGRSNGHA